MKFSRASLCSLIAALTLLAGVSTAGEAEEAAPLWDGIQRLNINLAAQETPPFLQLEKDPAEGKRQRPARAKSGAETVSGMAMRSNPAEAVDHKNQLRQSLVRDGQSSLESRDSLTSEVVSVTKWTIVMLIVGGVTIVGLKKFQLKSSAEGNTGNRIRILETLNLGRNQGLKLVEVGGERFLVASDQAGIKAVTMLPSWPAMDQEESAEQRLQLFSGEPGIFSASQSELAAG
ncbi:flagellar biosynthetic protein FliO [Planctomicrobium sp. SH661]|uniref:flagellar biosynthetic protein FliO n=1 Tax=Planctomicrobium sp. SH661 TaxID=3448124 RepID=UPI003F5C1A64